jgi:hypothetical protein
MAVIIRQNDYCQQWQESHTASISCQVCVMIDAC